MPNTMSNKNGTQGIILFSRSQRKDFQVLAIDSHVICDFLMYGLNYDALYLSYAYAFIEWLFLLYENSHFHEYFHTMMSNFVKYFFLTWWAVIPGLYNIAAL